MSISSIQVIALKPGALLPVSLPDDTSSTETSSFPKLIFGDAFAPISTTNTYSSGYSGEVVVFCSTDPPIPPEDETWAFTTI